MYFGIDIHYHLLDIVSLVIVLPISTVFADQASRYYIGRRDAKVLAILNDGASDTNKDGTKSVPKYRRRKKTFWARVIRPMSNTILISMIIVGYPLLVMPFYRASTTSDGARIIAVCIIHPIIHEIVLMMQRRQSGGTYTILKYVNDPERMVRIFVFDLFLPLLHSLKVSRLSPFLLSLAI